MATNKTESNPEAVNAGQTAPEFVTKLTLKTMGCNPARAAAAKSKVALARIYGVATGVKIKTDTKGDTFEAITGTFEGVNLETGEIFRSGLLFLPGGIHETLTVHAREDGAAVRFGLEIFAIPATNPIGYSYSAKSLLPQDAAAQDVLADMRDQIKITPKLDAPKKTA